MWKIIARRDLEINCLLVFKSPLATLAKIPLLPIKMVGYKKRFVTKLPAGLRSREKKMYKIASSGREERPSYARKIEIVSSLTGKTGPLDSELIPSAAITADGEFWGNIPQTHFHIETLHREEEEASL